MGKTSPIPTPDEIAEIDAALDGDPSLHKAFADFADYWADYGVRGTARIDNPKQPDPERPPNPSRVTNLLIGADPTQPLADQRSQAARRAANIRWSKKKHVASDP